MIAGIKSYKKAILRDGLFALAGECCRQFQFDFDKFVAMLRLRTVLLFAFGAVWIGLEPAAVVAGAQEQIASPRIAVSPAKFTLWAQLHAGRGAAARPLWLFKSRCRHCL